MPINTSPGILDKHGRATINVASLEDLETGGPPVVSTDWYGNPNKGIRIHLKGNTVGKFWLYAVVYGSSPQIRRVDGDFFTADDVTEYEIYDGSLTDGHHFVEQAYITNALITPATTGDLEHDPSVVLHLSEEQYFEVAHDGTLEGAGSEHSPLTVKISADKMFDYRMEEYKFAEITPASGIFDRVEAVLSGDTTTTFYMYGVYRDTNDDTDYGIKLESQYHQLFGVWRTSYWLNHNGIPFKAIRVLSNPLGQDRLEDFDILRNAGLVRSYYPPSFPLTAHDSTLSGDGTPTNPLKVVDPVPTLPADDDKQYAIKNKAWSEIVIPEDSSVPYVSHAFQYYQGAPHSVNAVNVGFKVTLKGNTVGKYWLFTVGRDPNHDPVYDKDVGTYIATSDMTVYECKLDYWTDQWDSDYVSFAFLTNMNFASTDVVTEDKVVMQWVSDYINGASEGVPDVVPQDGRRYVRKAGDGSTTQNSWESIESIFINKQARGGSMQTDADTTGAYFESTTVNSLNQQRLTLRSGVSSSRGPEFVVYDQDNKAFVFRGGKAYIMTNPTNPATDADALLKEAPADGKEYVRKDNDWAVSSGGGDVSGFANKITLDGGTMPIKAVGRDRPAATGRFSSWNPYPDTPPSMSDTSALANWLMARWYEGNDDEKYIGIMHVSAGDIAYNFTPQTGSDTIVENGIYVIELNVNHMSYRVIETWFDGTDWVDIGGFPQNYSYIFPENAGYFMTDPHDLTSSFLGNGYSMWEAPAVVFDLKDVAYSRATQSGSGLIGAITHWVPYPYDSLIGSYQPLVLFEGDELYVQGDLLRDISEPVRIYSIDHSFYIEHTTDHKILIVFDNEVLQTLENQGDTYRCIGFSAMDWMGIKGTQEDIQRVSTDLYIRGPAAIATVEDALTAVSDTASRSQYTVQIKKESLYRKVSDIAPLDPQRVWRVYNPVRMEETPVGVSNIIYVDGWKDSSSAGEYHYLCVAEDGIYASNAPVDENSWTKISGGGGSANFPFTTPAYDGNVAAAIPLIRTDSIQTSMSRGRMHSTMRLQVRPSGSNTFRTEIGQYRQASAGGDDDTIGDEDYAAGIGFSGNSQTSGSKVELLWGAAKRMRENGLSDLGDNEVVSIACLKKATGDPTVTAVREAEWGGSKTKIWVNSVNDYMNQRGEVRAFKAGYYSEKNYNNQDNSAHSETKQVLSLGAGASGSEGIQDYLPIDIHLGGNNIDIANNGQTKMAIGFEWNVIKPNATDIDDQWPNRWSGLFNVGYTGNPEPTYGDNSNFMSGWFVSDEDKAAMKGATDLGSGVVIPAGNKLVTVEYMNERLAALEARLAAAGIA